MFQHCSRLRGALSLAVLAFAVSACSAAPDGAAAIPSGQAANSAARIAQSGGGGSPKPLSTVDSIKVAKAEYFDQGGAVELLVSAVSSDLTAHLYLYDPSGVSLGEVQNGRGGKYGGSVFVTTSIPASLTLKSSSGGTVTVATTPFQP